MSRLAGFRWPARQDHGVQHDRHHHAAEQVAAMANLPVQKIKPRRAGRILRCCAAAFENPRRAVQQLLLPRLVLVRMNPIPARQLGHRPLALDRCQRCRVAYSRAGNA
jgi:hypothetical protein